MEITDWVLVSSSSEESSSVWPSEELYAEQLSESKMVGGAVEKTPWPA